MLLPKFFTPLKQEIDEALETYLAQYANASKLSEAMRYSVVLGGKRVRPILTIATAQCFGASIDRAMPAAIAVELIHAYSLIHDDLPAMDDDDLRRGQPTCHKAYNEALAILAGDGLQTLAFQVLSDDKLPHTSRQKINMIQELAIASGPQGMVLGQAIDLESEGAFLGLEALERMHALKTGKLIKAAIMLGAHSAESLVGDAEKAVLSKFADALGLAFQVQDDILDIISDTETLGKTQGADIALNKSTYPSLLGLQGAQQKVDQLFKVCRQALDQLDSCDTGQLLEIAQFVVQRRL
jgi:geranylgeranyl diphosphate synthase, type II